MPSRRRFELFTYVAAAAWLTATLCLTMFPVALRTPVPFWAFFSEVRAGVDYAQNVVLFLPLGWIINRGRWPCWSALAAGALVSGGIELVQVWVPGRTSTASDLLCNTLGAALGWWMAAPARQPRARLAAAFIALAGFLGLHQLNTAWPAPVDRADGAGVWQTVQRVRCPDGTRASAICVAVPNNAQSGSRYVRVVGPGEATFARVQSNVIDRPMGLEDCVLMLFESTRSTPLRLRPPIAAACGVAADAGAMLLLRVDPRLEHELPGEWTPTRAGVWMWPVWPFEAYQPFVLVAAGALGFVVLVALMTGAAPWVIPAGYLAVLEVVALVAGLRGPGVWEFGWTALAWALAFAAVRFDQRWRGVAVAAGATPGSIVGTRSTAGA
jgi:hypothetical protein